MLRIAINGYGRIGRMIVRALFQQGLEKKIHLTAINDPGDPHALAHLTRFDSTAGRFPASVTLHDETLQINGLSIPLLSRLDALHLPWQEMDVDLVLECSGKFKSRVLAEQHLKAGARRVLLSHPLDSADLTVVYGVNHHRLAAGQQVVSNASCTTNCLAPLAMVLHEACGIRSGLINTVHAYTNDQNLLDQVHGDLYRARAAGLSMVPTSTGAARTIGQVLPELEGRLDGLAVRVPTAVVSLLDLSFIAERRTTVNEVNDALLEASRRLPSGVMDCNELPLVSTDFAGHPASCVVDLTQTRVQGDLVKVMAWYDNEQAFALRMLDVAMHWDLACR